MEVGKSTMMMITEIVGIFECVSSSRGIKEGNREIEANLPSTEPTEDEQQSSNPTNITATSTFSSSASAAADSSVSTIGMQGEGAAPELRGMWMYVCMYDVGMDGWMDGYVGWW